MERTQRGRWLRIPAILTGLIMLFAGLSIAAATEAAAAVTQKIYTAKKTVTFTNAGATESFTVTVTPRWRATQGSDGTNTYDHRELYAAFNIDVNWNNYTGPATDVLVGVAMIEGNPTDQDDPYSLGTVARSATSGTGLVTGQYAHDAVSKPYIRIMVWPRGDTIMNPKTLNIGALDANANCRGEVTQFEFVGDPYFGTAHYQGGNRNDIYGGTRTWQDYHFQISIPEASYFAWKTSFPFYTTSSPTTPINYAIDWQTKLPSQYPAGTIIDVWRSVRISPASNNSSLNHNVTGDDVWLPTDNYPSSRTTSGSDAAIITGPFEYNLNQNYVAWDGNNPTTNANGACSVHIDYNGKYKPDGSMGYVPADHITGTMTDDENLFMLENDQWEWNDPGEHVTDWYAYEFGNSGTVGTASPKARLTYFVDHDGYIEAKKCELAWDDGVAGASEPTHSAWLVDTQWGATCTVDQVTNPFNVNPDEANVYGRPTVDTFPQEVSWGGSNPSAGSRPASADPYVEFTLKHYSVGTASESTETLPAVPLNED